MMGAEGQGANDCSSHNKKGQQRRPQRQQKRHRYDHPLEPSRRSTRIRFRPVRFSIEGLPPPPTATTTTATTTTAAQLPEVRVSQIMPDGRRNPKRKASEAANHDASLPVDLLGEALKPLTQHDIQEWEGWVELESEPAFFNIILRDLGVKHVTAREIFTIDPESLAMLPKPVFGLIFLFQFQPGGEESEDEQDTDEVWFANQTTHNACATVALLNIVMNAPDVELGANLRHFKDSTMGLNTALRGHQLSSNTFIRSIHNSFTRRMDHLNADLCLENEASAGSKKARKRLSNLTGRKRAKKRHPDTEYGFHFVAYVPAGRHVWELDGLRHKPRKIGPLGEGEWTSVARPRIEQRMLQDEEDQLAFNLLALCRSPLATYARDIAIGLRSLDFLHRSQQDSQEFANMVSAEGRPTLLDMLEDDTQLSRFGLTHHDVQQAQIPRTVVDQCGEGSSLSAAQAYEMHKQLTTDVKSSMGEHSAETTSSALDEQRVKGRKKDYGPALHKWVTKLAERGLLEDLIRNSTNTP